MGLFECDQYHLFLFFLRDPTGFGGLEVSGTPVDEFHGGSELDTPLFRPESVPEKRDWEPVPMPPKGGMQPGD